MLQCCNVQCCSAMCCVQRCSVVYSVAVLCTMLQCCAAAFIENLNAESLSIRAEDFERYMSGAATPHDPSQVITTCDGLRLMQQNVAALVDLRARQERLMAEAMQLQQDMVDFCAATREQVAALLARTPLDLRPRRTKVNLDDDPESTEAERLPPPLQPQLVNHGTTTSGTMCRSLSDFLSNITETTCTNSSLAPTTSAGVLHKFHEAVSATSAIDSSSKSSTADETGKSDFEPDVGETVKNPDIVTEMPAVSVTAEDAVAGLPADSSLEESCMSHADDSLSVSSLLLDATMTGGVDISLLDDPFIAIGAGCEKDSILEEQDRDTSWMLDDSDRNGCETMPLTSSPGGRAEGNAASLEVSLALVGVSQVPDTTDSLADTDPGDH